MTRDLDAFRAAALARLETAGTAAAAETAVEPALSHVTRACHELLGDRDAHTRPGALKEGERQFFVAGVFLAAPAAERHVLVAEHGFPPEQHRLQIPIDIAHPGHVYRTRAKLILENTDEHDGFRQILKTARMGSALYAPMIWQGAFVGQLVTAAQARNTFSAPDLAVIVAYAQLATALWAALDGPALLEALLAETA